MDFDRNQSAGYLINLLARLFARAIQDRIKPMDLSTGNFPAMLELWAKDGQSQRALVQRLNIEQATMANTLSRMERDGLIRKEPDPEDRRAQRICLTDKGRALEAPAIAAAHATNADMLSPLSDAEQRQFIDMLRRLIAHRQHHD